MHVPDGWNDGHVKDLLAGLNSGVSVNGEDIPANKSEIGVLKVSSVSYGVFLPNQNKRVIESELNLVKESPRKGSILISRSNTEALVGASVYIYKDYPNLFLPDKLWQTIPRKEKIVDQKWLFYFLSSEPTRYRLSKLATGTSGSMKNITKGELLTLPIRIPPYLEQQKIAKILSSWDKAIEKLEALIAAKQKRKKALMQQLLTGKKRFVGFEAEWKTYRLGELFNERNETGYIDLSLLSITREKGVIPRDEVERKDTSNEDKSKYLRICPGDIGYNTMRMWQGVSALSTLEGIISPAYTVCIPTLKIDGKFASYLFKSTPIVHLFQRYSQGLTSDTWNLKFHHFGEIQVCVPEDLDEQRKIASALSAADTEIETQQKQLAVLKEQKKGLMQQLLTGKRRVIMKTEI